MSLKVLFATPIIVILLLTLSLAGMIGRQEWAAHTRGLVAIEATSRADILNRLEAQLSRERTVTWDAFEADYPLPDRDARLLTDVRRETDRIIAELIANGRAGGRTGAVVPDAFLVEIQNSLVAARAEGDGLLRADHQHRPYEAFRAVMPKMLGPAGLLGPQLGRAAADAIKAEPELAGIIAVARIGLVLRETLGGIAAITLPRLDSGEQLTDADIAKVRSLLIEVDGTTKILEAVFYLATPTEEMRQLLASAKEVRSGIVQQQLNRMLDADLKNTRAAGSDVWNSRPFAIWSDRVNALRAAIIRETVERVLAEQAARDAWLKFALTAIAAVVTIILVAVIVLQRSVVGPLAQLGFAITRIADGDRRSKLVIHSTTREIATMVTAVETLRQAALVADVTALRQREAAERRLRALREILGILQFVKEPSHTLENDVARLSEGMDAAMAMTAGAPLPALDTAVAAVRSGLQEMRKAVRELDAIIDAARGMDADVLGKHDIAACITEVQGSIEHQDVLTRAFIQPCLLALRDASPLADEPRAGMLRELIDAQFELIESTVATMASMRATVAKACAIVRDLPLDAEPLAA